MNCKHHQKNKTRSRSKYNLVEFHPGSRKTEAANIIPPRTDVKPNFRHARTPMSAWNVFFSDDILSAIVASTNAKIIPKVNLVGNCRAFHDIKYTDSDEVKAFIGLCKSVLHGRWTWFEISNLKLPTSFQWNLRSRNFLSTMYMNRFGLISANISSDDFTTRKYRCPYDKFVGTKEMFETFNKYWGMAVNVSHFLSLD